MRSASLAALLAACAPTLPTIAPERSIADATGVEDAFVLRVAGGPIEAEGTLDPARLTFPDALHASLVTSSELQVALARVRSALAHAEQSRLLANPVLDVVVRWPEGGGSSVVEVAPSIAVAALLERPRRASAADARLRAAVSTAVRTALDVGAELAERYADVQALDELAARLSERRGLLGRLVDVARSRLEFGEASRLDVTTLEAQRIELDLELAQRAAERTRARIALSRALGRPSDAGAWELDDWGPTPAALEGEPAWIAAALAHRPEIAERRWELAALGDEEGLAHWAIFEGTSVGLAAERDGVWTLGPSASVPLPLFDTGSARREAVVAAIVEARHELVRVQRDVITDVRRAHAACRAARAELERMLTELLPVQRDRREQVEAIYLAGQTDLSAVLLAEQDLQAAHARLVELEHEAAVQRTRLERAVGGARAARSVSSAAAARGRDHDEEQGREGGR